jgi:hypothetical protein
VVAIGVKDLNDDFLWAKLLCFITELSLVLLHRNAIMQEPEESKNACGRKLFGMERRAGTWNMLKRMT